jgi:hypothetical protein
MADNGTCIDPEAPSEEVIKTLKKLAGLSKKFASGSAVCVPCCLCMHALFCPALVNNLDGPFFWLTAVRHDSRCTFIAQIKFTSQEGSLIKILWNVY